MRRTGMIFVVSAPSGAGKTSLCSELLKATPGLQVSVSYTTRPKRGGETNGIDYHFVSVEKFRQMIDAGAFVEWAQVHDNFYGTSLATLEQASQAGQDILLDIDCQGAAQLREKLDNGVYVFILPPDFEELARRLAKRNSDTDEVIQKRIANARHEVLEAKHYDYIVINDNFDFALDQLKAILSAETSRAERVLPVIKKKFHIT